MRILLLNQFIPPDPAPTSKLLGDVGEELRNRGHELVWVGNEASYHGSKTLLGSRALRELSELGKLAIRGLRSPRCERIVFLTSPPFLPVIAKIIRWRHPGAQLVHWAMDVYPDVAVALGETRKGSFIARITGLLMANAYRSCDSVIALDEDMADLISSHGVAPTIQAPWPPAIQEVASVNLPEPPEKFRILYSGNLGRAHDWKTILDALQILQQDGIPVEMIFQGGGNERENAKSYADEIELTNCFWLPYVDTSALLPSLLAADTLLVTQREETKGCLWPSKLALSELTGIPILWIGPGESAVTNWLESKGHFPFPIGSSDAVASCIRDLVARRSEIVTEKRSVPTIAADANQLAVEGRTRICDQITKKHTFIISIMVIMVYI